MVVYKVTNLVNKKIYIGKTTKSAESRWKEHLQAAARGIEYQIYRAIRKYGSENFSLEVVASGITTIEELNLTEMRTIAFYRSNETLYGYNMTLGGDGGSLNEEVRKRISQTKSGIPQTEVHKGKRSESLKHYYKTHPNCIQKTNWAKKLDKKCKVCNTDKDLVKKRAFCRTCYNNDQKLKMRTRLSE